MAFNFDPNMNLSGNVSIKTVKLTFGVWEYRYSIEIEARGNTSGLDVIRHATDLAYEKLYDGFEMTCGNGDTLLVEDDEGQEENWLYDMLISAEISSMVPAGTV